jgi:hypothetical protein
VQSICESLLDFPVFTPLGPVYWCQDRDRLVPCTGSVNDMVRTLRDAVCFSLVELCPKGLYHHAPFQAHIKHVIQRHVRVIEDSKQVGQRVVLVLPIVKVPEAIAVSSDDEQENELTLDDSDSERDESLDIHPDPNLTTALNPDPNVADNVPAIAAATAAAIPNAANAPVNFTAAASDAATVANPNAAPAHAIASTNTTHDISISVPFLLVPPTPSPTPTASPTITLPIASSASASSDPVVVRAMSVEQKQDAILERLDRILNGMDKLVGLFLHAGDKRPPLFPIVDGVPSSPKKAKH